MAQAEQLFSIETKGVGRSVDVLPPNEDRCGIHMQNIGAVELLFTPDGYAEAGRAFKLMPGDSLTLEYAMCPRSGDCRVSGAEGGVLLVFETSL